MFAMAKVMQLLLGWNFDLCIWVSSVTVAVYVSLGGLLSAVFNEVLQYFLIWLGTLLVPDPWARSRSGGWSRMLASINAQHPGTELSPDSGPTWVLPADNPMGMHWTGMVFGLGIAVSFGYWCTDFLQVQRVIAARRAFAPHKTGQLIGADASRCLCPSSSRSPDSSGSPLLTQKEGIVLVAGERRAGHTGGQ